ncbi:alpha-amylase family protein [Nostoc sp. NIES-3756]|uniref:alpha-amylase family glycosyl hydrolase n=1 Tax=Nostoc sp. NIES-3756 TaxID=1751286 RepID=UPI00071F1E65|nr:alpha-amylase family glycosyl hydrolase [Nostoc sp. NIES-3756]BAT53881.1 alpha-amylase family protein [Nostoc sp. NIES-3756]
MLQSIYSQEIDDIFSQARDQALRNSRKSVQVGDQVKEIPTPFPSPTDWRDTWIYFIMIDRFNNPSSPPQKAWNALGEEGLVFQGGTFEGIRQQLDYLEKLGVGAIWLTPPLKNCQYKRSYHGYGIQDFLQIDPRFASDKENPEAELQRLIDEAHARGIYVIFDIVLNHAGNVFTYLINDEKKESFSFVYEPNNPYDIMWHDHEGKPEWKNADVNEVPDLHTHAAVWPKELRQLEFFRRRGTKDDTEQGGDFSDLRELVTGIPEVRNILIRIHEYLIAKFDIDGFRIDTLRFIEPDFARVFGNAMHEFALSLGKKNFFTFGEIWANEDNTEEKISRFVGRNASEPGDLLGIDAALDFPLFFQLPGVFKGLKEPKALADVYVRRRESLRGIISSNGEVSRFFVTFFDNHDLKSRFYYSNPEEPQKFDDQVTLAIACLFTLQGIPCIYYGTEQGLNGAVDNIPFGDLVVRQALWGKPGGGFNIDHPFYKAIAEITQYRKTYPTLRYGRQYFRPISGDRINYGVSPFKSGVVAFSRILNEQEVVIVANTHTESQQSIYVIVDYNLNSQNPTYKVLYSNKTEFTQPEKVAEQRGVNITEPNGHKSYGPIRAMKVTLQPMEVQILVK